MAAGVVAWVRRTDRLGADVLRAVPADVWLVARIDARAWIDSTSAARLREWIDARLDRGLVRRTCGFDPFEAVQTVVLFARRDEGAGLVAVGDLDADRLGLCLRILLDDPLRPVRAVDIDGRSAIAVGRARALFVTRDALVVADEPTVRAVIDVVERRAPSVATDTRIAALRARLGDARAAELLVLAPDAWRRGLHEHLEGPLRPLASMGAAGMSIERAAEANVRAAIDVGDAAGARRAAEALSEAIGRVGGGWIAALSAEGRWLRRASIRADGSWIVGEVSGPAGELDTLIEALARRLSEARGAGTEPDPLAGDGPMADEVIGPTGQGGTGEPDAAVVSPAPARSGESAPSSSPASRGRRTNGDAR